MNDTLKGWIPKLAGQRVLVVGDLILDEYLTGRVARVSREAPVPVLEYESRQLIPGGAANPSANICRLGSEAIQLGLIGADPAATQLRQLLQAHGIETNALVTDASRPTTVKMRLMAHMDMRFPQQVARLDTLSRDPISPEIELRIETLLRQHLPQVGAVLLSDYHGGMLTGSLLDRIRVLAADHGVLLTADTQGDLDKYRGFGLVKCNAEDARQYLNRDLGDDEAFAQAASDLFAQLGLQGAMVITRGPDGATIATSDAPPQHCRAPAISDVYDVVGAGDTSIAVLTLALAVGAPYAAATTLANYASGLVVRRVGNYAPTPEELAWALDSWTLG